LLAREMVAVAAKSRQPRTAERATTARESFSAHFYAGRVVRLARFGAQQQEEESEYRAGDAKLDARLLPLADVAPLPGGALGAPAGKLGTGEEADA
jgi:hypothetical protein